MNVLEEAAHIVSGERQAKYGHPLDNWTDTACLWNVLLRAKLIAPLTADDAILMMIAVKLVREVHAKNRDNQTDMAGYARCLEMLDEERRRRGGMGAQTEGP